MPSKKETNLFTLVELMVVIVIISVLAAMLLPTLGRARELSRQTLCANNLRQTGIAVSAYGDGNEGRIPPFSSGIGDERWKNTVTGWWHGANPYYHPWVTLIVNYSVGHQFPLNHGKLFAGDFSNDYRPYYCPSMDFEHFRQDQFVEAWKDPFNRSINTSYNYNPYAKRLSADWGDVPAYRTLIEFGNDHPLQLDLLTIWRPVDVAHRKSGIGWNLLFADGRVSFRKSRDTMIYLLGNVSGSGAMISGDDWRVFNTARQMLEEAE